MNALGSLLDLTAERLADVGRSELPLFGRHWTVTLDDNDVVLRIKATKVNGTPVPRQPPPPPPPPPDKGGK